MADMLYIKRAAIFQTVRRRPIASSIGACLILEATSITGCFGLLVFVLKSEIFTLAIRASAPC